MLIGKSAKEEGYTMTMREIIPTGAVKAVLDKFYNAGGGIDFVLIEIVDAHPSDYELDQLHREAAIFTVRVAAARYPDSYERGPGIEPEKAEGDPIEVAEFFMPPYIWIADPTPPSSFFKFKWRGGPEAAFTRQELQASARAKRKGGYYQSTASYSHAFFDPPYGFRVKEPAQFFHEFNQHLFGDNRDALSIYSWSTDWAEYFKPGDEWWGSYLWTVYNTQSHALVGIAASQTD